MENQREPEIARLSLKESEYAKGGDAGERILHITIKPAIPATDRERPAGRRKDRLAQDDDGS